MDPWKMPDWMKPYESFFRDNGAFSVEATMNMYGAKAALRLAQADSDLRGTLINTQVGLLTALQGAGLLLPARIGPAPEIACPACHELKTHQLWKGHDQTTYYGCGACGAIFGQGSCGIRNLQAWHYPREEKTEAEKKATGGQ